MRPTVISAIFSETSTYDDQFNCALETHYDGEVHNRLMHSTHGGRDLNSTTLASAVGSAISMQARVGREIHIPGGWGEKRLSFIITLLTSDVGGSKQRQVLTGYTDYNGVNLLRGELDPNMRLFINNSIIIRDTSYGTGRGEILRPRIESSEYIVRGRSQEHRGGFRREPGDRLIRPHDIFNNIGISDYQRMHGGSDEIVDARADFTGNIKMGKRLDNNPAEYFTTVLKAGIMAETTEPRTWNPDSQFGGEEMSRSELAAGAVNVSNSADNPVFTEFLMRCDFAKTGSILLSEMEDACDWAEVYRGEQVNKFFSTADVEDRGYKSYRRGEGESWKGAGPERVAMSIIAAAIPSILMTHYISDAIIQFTNDNARGDMRVIVTNARALIPGTNITKYYTAVEEMIRIQVADPISRNGEFLVDCHIDCSAVTDIKIRLSLDGGEEVYRAVPIFCDGLVSPQKTDDLQLSTKITNDLQATIQEVADNLFQVKDRRDDENVKAFSWE